MELKALYYSSVVVLMGSLYSMGFAAEDDDSPKTLPQRVAFMVSEYACFLSGCIALAFPRVGRK
jgi:hypothetical protein